MTVSSVRVAIIGGGPAGIAAAIAASADGASVLLIERETRLGGKLKQAIHDGFGFVRYDNALTGPEYAYLDISTLNQTRTIILLQTSVLRIASVGNAFQLTLSNRHGITTVDANAIVLATGCRERTFSEVGIHGARPAGVFTAGSAQRYMNIMGQLPVKTCAILGSDNLALITARRLILDGAKILGVYEQNTSPKGYLDYVSRCLYDFDIPLHLSHTVTRVFGTARLRAIELARTDKSSKPIRGSEKIAQCDGLVISSGFIPDNALAVSLGVAISEDSHAPLCDQNRMTMTDGIFSCGNAEYISDLVDYVSESGEIAGHGAARYLSYERQLLKIEAGNVFLTYSPHYIDYNSLYSDIALYFTVSSKHIDATVRVYVDSTEVLAQKFDALRPLETYRLAVHPQDALTSESRIYLRMN